MADGDDGNTHDGQDMTLARIRDYAATPGVPAEMVWAERYLLGVIDALTDDRDALRAAVRAFTESFRQQVANARNLEWRTGSWMDAQVDGLERVAREPS